MTYAKPGAEGSIVSYAARYDNFIGGDWTAPVEGQYFENPSPVDGQTFTEVARSTAADVELALDAAHTAADGWGATSVAERANILNKIADRIEDNLEALAVAETWENGKPVRETKAADLPLAIDHFRYFAGCHPRPGGRDQRNRRRHHRLPLPRTARRGRPDHPLELPDPDGHLEAGARAGGR